MTKGHCTFLRPDGTLCGTSALRESGLCFFHDPALKQEAAKARELGGLRRRREGSVSGAYDFLGLDSVPAIRRLLEIAALDTLALDNSLARARTLVQVAIAAIRMLEVGELEARIERLQESVHRIKAGDTAFDDDIDEAEYRFLPPDAISGEAATEGEDSDGSQGAEDHHQ